MRVFQNIGLYPAYLPRIEAIWGESEKFKDMVRDLLKDRFNGVHHLKPAIEYDDSCFFTSGDNPRLQRAWANEMGILPGTSIEHILLAQIEEHKTEVFYNLDPVRYGNSFIKRLPGCVRRTIAWRAAPSGLAQFFEHDLIVNNYPSLADQFKKQGANTAYFAPGHDPSMDFFSENVEKPIDILFIGGYSRHHLERAQALDLVSRLSDRYNVVFNLDVSRATRLSETPLGLFGPLRKLRRPSSIRKVSRPPIFGLDMYRQISRAKVVINGKVDIAGLDRGNMRVWETLGCGAALLTDTGRYPHQMRDGRDFATYRNVDDLSTKIEELLESTEYRKTISESGNNMIRTKFSKTEQWLAFQDLA